jgi:hypothetical protein
LPSDQAVALDEGVVDLGPMGGDLSLQLINSVAVRDYRCLDLGSLLMESLPLADKILNGHLARPPTTC